MEETETLVLKYTKNPPQTAIEVSKCLPKLYDIIPRLQPPGFDVAKTLALRDALFVTMCDYYCQLADRIMINTQNFLTPACGLYIICAALTLISREKYEINIRPYSLIGKLGILPSDNYTISDFSLVELFDAVWLIGLRWSNLRIYSPEDLDEITEYLKTLTLRSFFFIQIELETVEVSPKLVDFVEKTDNGKYKANTRLIRRFCEGLCRPMSVLRILRDIYKSGEVSSADRTKIQLLRQVFKEKTKDFLTVDSFTGQIRDFIEIASISPTEYANFTDVSRDDKYIPHMMLTLSRPSQFLARRTWYANAIPIRKLITIDETDEAAYSHVNITDRLGSLAVKMYCVNANFESTGISVICDYLIMEPFLQTKIHESSKKKEPYFIMALGMIHVLFKDQIYMCPLGFEQAVIVWTGLILSENRGLLDGKNITKDISKLFQPETSQTKSATFSWNVSIEI